MTNRVRSDRQRCNCRRAPARGSPAPFRRRVPVMRAAAGRAMAMAAALAAAAPMIGAAGPTSIITLCANGTTRLVSMEAFGAAGAGAPQTTAPPSPGAPPQDHGGACHAPCLCPRKSAALKPAGGSPA